MGQNIGCPVCHELVTQSPKRRYTVQEAADHFCPAARNADRNARLQNCIRRIFGGDVGEVYRCDSCGFGFAWPFTGGDEEFYAILHEQAGYTRWGWDYDLTLARLKGIPAGKILDIGAGDGAFLKSVDPAWKTFATEGSETTRDAACRGHRMLREHAGCYPPGGGNIRRHHHVPGTRAYLGIRRDAVGLPRSSAARRHTDHLRSRRRCGFRSGTTDRLR